MTASRGGSRSWWLLQRLVSKPFRVTYGNLRISDVTAEFVRASLEQYAEDPNRRWLVSWLQEDVREAIRLGASYSTSVPFKLRALPKSSDGILQAAEVRFAGRLVCLFGPLGQSQVDQFAAMVIDNDLGHSIGMPTGGASNTWEWQQTVLLGNEQAPLVDFMWTIGHTIRPNGQVLEGNPPIPKELVVMTRRNFVKYYEGLLRRAERWLGY